MKKDKERLLEDYSLAVNNLKEGLDKAVDDLDVDGTIKRFELCYELAWKVIKNYLSETGIICKNPRDCFKSAKANGLIKDELGWLYMIEDRNRLVHTYTMEFSRQVFEKIKSSHFRLMNSLLQAIKED